MLDIAHAPFPVSYRDLWLPGAINAAALPSSGPGNHPLTLTGAGLRTTAQGVHFNGAVTSNINCGAIHNAQAKLNLSFRFKLDAPFVAGVAADQYLWGKYIGVNDYIAIWLENADGALYFRHRSGGVDLFTLISAEVAWKANTWYHVYAATGQAAGGGAPTDGARLRINNGAALTDADATALPNGGDFIIGDLDDPGAGTGFVGVITDFFGGITDVSAVSETALYHGCPQGAGEHNYTLDEGRGVTAYDRGAGGNNGTLDTSATWSFDRVRQPVIGPDGLGDYAAHAANAVDITGDCTVIYVAKMKNVYAPVNLFDMAPLSIYPTAGSLVLELWGIAWRFNHCGVVYPMPVNPAIDDYWIIVVSTDAVGTWRLYLNGYLVTTQVGVPTVGLASVYLCNNGGTIRPDASKLLLLGIASGAFTAKQALTYSRWIRDMMNLPISI